MGNPPLVSVIMPVRNEADFIERSLGAVLSQDYAANSLEVLVADGLSSDSTRELITAVAQRHPRIPVTILDNPAGRASTGLNVALSAAHGEIIVRVDGHTLIAPDYVTQCVATLTSRPGAQNVGGRMNPSGTQPFARAVSLATSSRFGVGGGRFHYSEREEWVDTVYLGAWPRELFERIGLFDEEMVRNQDDEFNYRLLSQGGKILLSPKIKSEYYNRTTIRSLWAQYFSYGYWKVRVLQKHPFQMRPRQFVPGLFVLVLATCVVLSAFSSQATNALIGLTILYLLLNVLASLLVCSRSAQSKSLPVAKLLPLVSLAFAVLHFAYGFGFLAGLVGFWNRWGNRGQSLNTQLPLQSGKQL